MKKVKSPAGLKTSKRGGPGKSKGHVKGEREKEKWLVRKLARAS